MQKAKLIFMLFLFIFLLSVQIYSGSAVEPAQAANLWENQIGVKDGGHLSRAFGSEQAPTDIRIVVARVIKVFLSLIGTIFLVLMVYAGFRWMTAGGNESAVGEAKSQLINATIGLAIILISYAITSFLARCVFNISTGSTIWMCN